MDTRGLFRRWTRVRLVAVISGLMVLAIAGLGAQDTGLKIAPRDQLTVTVIGSPDYSGKYQVDPDGMFEDAPLGRRLKAAGLSTSEVATAVKRELAARVFVNPQVTVELEQSAHMRVMVTGEVKSTGAYPFTGEMRVLEALIRAGSVTDAAGDTAVIIRESDGATGANLAADPKAGIHVNIHALLTGDMKDNLLLHDGDTLIVLKTDPVYINGFVKAPGQYRLQRGMTVEQALTLAGGLTEQGSTRGIKIKRVVNGKPVEIKVKLTDIVEPGDTITVPRSIL